jgi:hypothetical protein
MTGKFGEEPRARLLLRITYLVGDPKKVVAAE